MPQYAVCFFSQEESQIVLDIDVFPDIVSKIEILVLCMSTSL